MDKMTVGQVIGRWSELVHRPLTAFERAKIARPIRYNSKTGKYSRLLKPVLGGFPYGYVEMDLTYDPETGSYPLGLVIHTEAVTRQDTFLSSYPDPETQIMVMRFGGDDEKVKELLYYDVWGALDDNLLLDRWQHSFAPVPLMQVVKPEANLDVI